LPLGFEVSGSNGGSRRGGISGGGGGGDSGRRRQHQQPATMTSKHQQQQQQQQQQQCLERRYAWNGNKVVCLEGEEEEESEKRGGGESEQQQQGPCSSEARKNKLRLASRSLDRALEACSRSFFPDPASVSPDYWAYCRWRGAHRLCSSMLSNFATQALLAAVGVGASRSLPAAAGINWLLKDGLGRVGRLGVAARFGEAFDADIKRFRFATSVLFTASVGLELATPAFPRRFLALAAAANVGKAIGLTTYISTQPSFGASFARGANLADVTAKAQAQQMVVDTAGLALCVGVLGRVGARAAAAGARAGAASSAGSSSAAAAAAATCAAPAVAGGEAAAAAAAAAKSASAAFRRSFGGGVPPALLALLAAGDLFFISRELKSVHLRTLNRERAELAAEAWLVGRKATRSAGGDGEERSEGGGRRGPFGLGRWRRDPGPCSPRAPSPEAIAAAEPLLFPARPGSGLLPLRLSRLEDAGLTSRRELDDALSRRSEGNDKFLLIRVAPETRTKQRNYPGSSLRLVLLSDAGAGDALVGVLAAAHARAEILEQQQQQQGERNESRKKNTKGSSGNGDAHDNSAEKQQRLLSRAMAAARRDGPAFYEALEDAGWQVEPFLLSPRERGGLVVLG